jgi:hypothetical protein
LATICPCMAVGQGFETIIEDIAKQRAKVTSYHVTITGETTGEPEQVELSNGTIFVRKKIPVGFTLELAVDQESRRRLIARKDHLLVKATGKQEFSRWYVYVETPERKIYYNDIDGSVGRGFVTKPDRNAPKPPHFDPLALGLMFAGEFGRGDSLESIVKNYSDWENGFKQFDLPGGKWRFTGKLGNSKSEFYLIVDPQKGIWPVEMAVGNPPTIRQELSIEKFKGVWLPAQTSFFHSDKTTKLDFQWHSVNQSIDDDLFELDDVEKKYSFLTKKTKR